MRLAALHLVCFLLLAMSTAATLPGFRLRDVASKEEIGWDYDAGNETIVVALPTNWTAPFATTQLCNRDVVNFFPNCKTLLPERILMARADLHCPPGTHYFRSNSQPSYSMCLRTDDLVDNYIRSDGRWLDCDKLLAPGLNPQRKTAMTFVDVGANVGGCALLLSAAGHSVFAFEPSPDNFALLQANYRLNGFDTGRIFNAGVAAVQGETTFWQEHGNTGNTLQIGGDPEEREARLRHAGTVSVPTYVKVDNVSLVTLDDLVHDHIDVLKMDCQGCELSALKGASRLFAEEAISVVAFELGPTFLRAGGVENASELLYFLHDRGFANWVAGNPHDTSDGILTPPETFFEVCAEVESRVYPFTDVIARHHGFWAAWYAAGG